MHELETINNRLGHVTTHELCCRVFAGRNAAAESMPQVSCFGRRSRHALSFHGIRRSSSGKASASGS